MISKTLDATENILCLPLLIHSAFKEHVSATQIRTRRLIDSQTRDPCRTVAIMTSSKLVYVFPYISESF